MKIAIFSVYPSFETINTIKEIIKFSKKLNHGIILSEMLKKYFNTNKIKYKYFKNDRILNSKIDFLFSVGGDGTLLRSITVVRNTETPILGINTGQLGFLTGLLKESLKKGLKLLMTFNSTIHSCLSCSWS